METRVPATLVDTTNNEPAEPAASLPVTVSQGVEALKDVTFGSIAGAVGKVIEYPFDTVKVRLQAQPDHLPLQYKGPLDCFRQSIAADGVRGLYRGVSAPLTGAAAETASLFFSYRITQDLIRTYSGVDDLSLPALATAGAISGGVTSLILTPIELVKCRMQVPQVIPIGIAARALPASAPLSPFTVIATVWRHEGLRGFWRGQLGTFLRETGGSAAWFGSYEASSQFFRVRQEKQAAVLEFDERNPAQLAVWQQMMSGALAGIAYNFLFFPADTIKSKMQTGELSHIRPNFMTVARVLWKAHGLKGLYRGCGITVARSAPSSALIFTIMEQLKSAFA